ncbi:hypothetical protein K466DRAFT_505324 [Polyporus arcularius HHB13444]|uniref:CCHC-type domain-containing protein n=1 Tax=Polyporus arcularius HHB13444 TaxID=1314778 RepID=A0A5C3NPV5_9APHY|nr:hypothetical protein K466DRAFT_505324 [Polyporus arcularius HHB13444]
MRPRPVLDNPVPDNPDNNDVPAHSDEADRRQLCRVNSCCCKYNTLSYGKGLRDAKLDNEDVILVLTNGLPPSYSQLIVNLNSTPPSELTIDYVTARLLNEEAHQLAANPGAAQQAQTTAAFHAAPHPCTPIEEMMCFNCGKKGHY